MSPSQALSTGPKQMQGRRTGCSNSKCGAQFGFADLLVRSPRGRYQLVNQAAEFRACLWVTISANARNVIDTVKGNVVRYDAWAGFKKYCLMMPILAKVRWIS
jgi:hypothetical protein